VILVSAVSGTSFAGFRKHLAIAESLNSHCTPQAFSGLKPAASGFEVSKKQLDCCLFGMSRFLALMRKFNSNPQ
jgi:hypothetical protein